MKPSVMVSISFTLAVAACGGTNGISGGIDAPVVPSASSLYDDFSASGIDGQKWNLGQLEALLTGGMAALSQTIVGAQPGLTYSAGMVVAPQSNGDVTTIETDVVIDSATATGTAYARASVDLLYQPIADRLQGPNNNDHLMIARMTLERLASGSLLARYALFECALGSLNCSQSTAIGTKTGTWPPGTIVVSTGTTYTVSITVDRIAKTFTFTLSSGTLNASATVDVSGVTTPWVPDLSASNFYQARLRAQVGGGASGGDGSIAARFDNVRLGVDGSPAAPFDDFDTGTTFDSSKWTIGGESVQLASGTARMSLQQKDKPASLALGLADTAASALQADVTVTQHGATGSGRVCAQLRKSLYNDGSNGSGIAPDTNGPNSMVGDLLASITITGTDVSYAVVRCETAQCATSTFVKPYTSLGSVALGTRHTLYLNWDVASHQVQFKLDGNPAVAFDPVAAGYAISSAAPSVPSKRIAVVAGAGATDRPFATGSSGSITATFDNVRTN